MGLLARPTRRALRRHWCWCEGSVPEYHTITIFLIDIEDYVNLNFIYEDEPCTRSFTFSGV